MYTKKWELSNGRQVRLHHDDNGWYYLGPRCIGNIVGQCSEKVAVMYIEKKVLPTLAARWKRI